MASVTGYRNNAKLVAVDQGPRGVHIYEVFNVRAYLRKCHHDGKRAIYLGISNSQGSLTQESINLLHNFSHNYGN